MKDWDRIEKYILPRVRRPARYIGQEWNAIYKDWDKAKLRVVLVYPDVYEVGMSHLGLRILYHVLNGMEGVLAERAYAPWVDMENFLRREGIHLYSLESKRALAEFDVVGISLPHEMCYTNILTVLELGGVSVWSDERGEEEPLVLGGGVGAFNPEPVAPFFDAILVGDGEEGIVQIARVLKELCVRRQKQRFAGGKEHVLSELAKIEGVYVPCFYRVAYEENGQVKEILPSDGAPARVRKRVCFDLDKTVYPEKVIVPNIGIVHDRLTLEIMRGCTRGCRFCQAGIIYRPVRERAPERLLELAERGLKSTGYSDVSLTSLSSGDYSRIEELVEKMLGLLKEYHGTLSVSSLHVDARLSKVAERLAELKRTGITLAPETGTDRLREIINKGMRNDEIFEATGDFAKYGWRLLKLYFMVGLPEERWEDVEGIARLVEQIGRRNRYLKLHVSVAPFVPKPHTPFQWVGMDEMDEIQEKITFLRKSFARKKWIEFHWHDVRVSMLEGVFSRGDRRLSEVIFYAWRQGARFDSWAERFDFNIWLEAFDKAGLDPKFYANRERDAEEVFPWDHIDPLVSLEFLLKEFAKAKKGIPTPDCRKAGCVGCGIPNCPISRPL